MADEQRLTVGHDPSRHLELRLDRAGTAFALAIFVATASIMSFAVYGIRHKPGMRSMRDPALRAVQSGRPNDRVRGVPHLSHSTAAVRCDQGPVFPFLRRGGVRRSWALEIRAHSAGEYSLEFDNSFSILAPKAVDLRIRVVPPGGR